MVESVPADQTQIESDIYVTDPPYGDAVKYEEILDFFIAWLRRRPPKEFSKWTWDSRRSLALKGEDEDFRRTRSQPTLACENACLKTVCR
jgi:putative DNA methylase